MSHQATSDLEKNETRHYEGANVSRTITPGGYVFLSTRSLTSEDDGEQLIGTRSTTRKHPSLRSIARCFPFALHSAWFSFAKRAPSPARQSGTPRESQPLPPGVTLE